MGVYAHGVFALRKNARTLAVVLALAALAGAGAWLGGRMLIAEKTVPSDDGSLETASWPAVPAQALRDSDHDGLKDWEEVVWGTDPAHADSDGDGTPDGEEVAQNRDPRKPGPDDGYAPLADEAGPEGPPPEPENLTAQLGARIYADIQSGAAASSRGLEAAARGYAADLGGLAVLSSAPRYSERNLTPAGTDDLAAILNFFAAIEQVWAKRFAANQPTDLEVFFASFERQGADVAARLEPYRAGYAEAIATIRGTPVPSEFRATAVTLLNFLSRVERSTALMQNFDRDPLAAVLAVRERLALNEELDAFVRKAVREAEPIVRQKVAEFAAQQNR